MFDSLKNFNYCVCCWLALQTQTVCDSVVLFHRAFCKELEWVGFLERFWLLTSVFLFTRCPNRLETSSLSPKPLRSSQQTVHSSFFSICLPSVFCFLIFYSSLLWFSFNISSSLKDERETHLVQIIVFS